ncbi:hypothetical protein BH23PLA1_BH23PLA1_41960 [soil metagenome]
MSNDSGRPALPIPEPLRREAVRLLDQQMWCWGQDIRCPAGNALIRYGFQRLPVAPGITGCTAYAKPGEAGGQFVVWGSGLFFGSPGDGGLALRRLEFRPTWTPRDTLAIPLLTAGAVPSFHQSADVERLARLIQGAIDQIVAYESWAAETLGQDHRCQCVATWKKSTVPADQIIPAWKALLERWPSAG